MKRERIVFLRELDNFLSGNLELTKFEAVADLVILGKLQFH